MSTVHEDFTRDSGHRGGSDRNFGLVFTGAFLIFGLLPLRHGKPIRLWCLVASALVLCITLAKPSLLRIPNRLWTKLGVLLGMIVSPIVTGALFFLVFTPFGMVRKWMGKDPLGLTLDQGAKSYWTLRNTAEKSSSMTNQF